MTTDPLVRYHFYTVVRDLFERAGQWYIHFEGSWEALCIGDYRPGLEIGDKVHITFMKEE